jgi:hypothetical protein
VADEQQASIGPQTRALGEGSSSVKAPGERRMDQQPLAPLLTPVSSGQLRGLACAHLGAEQDGVKAHLQTPKRDPNGVRLAFPARGQTTLGIRANAVRLRLGVT